MKDTTKETSKTVIVTGCAGFIGMHVSQFLLKEDWKVVGVDSLNDYYDVTLKHARLNNIRHSSFHFIHKNIAHEGVMDHLCDKHRPTHIIHLAAQAGVRASIQDPIGNIDNNITAFVRVLEACKIYNVQHLVYASSSSVYGANNHFPSKVSDRVDKPVSLYAATKRCNEMMAYTYSHLYNIAVTGLRFFTVYGPWGRPDMSMWIFTKAILDNKPITIFNHGDMERDFTFIDDIVQGVCTILTLPPTTQPAYALYNIGNHQPLPLMDAIGFLEDAIGQKAIKHFAPLQPGDVRKSYADTQDFRTLTGFAPHTSFQEGIKRWFSWYKTFYV